MASLELYINNQLCEIESPENFSVYLKRQLLNPAELSTKDAQRSYDISLPATATNNAIFGYTNTEEVRGKFSQLYDAQLLVNGIKIFDGKFKISEIGKDYYKGNLGVPAAKTVKDIFGEMKMNQAGKWPLKFEKIEDVTIYNEGKHEQKTGEDDEISPCIFPLALYKLMTKESLNNTYSAKNVYDRSVRFALEDFPPSVNCIHMLKKIFKQAEYNLTGNALHDERLRNLYMSYKNPNDYEMQWGTGTTSISGTWSNYVKEIRSIESNYYMTSIWDESPMSITTNLFDSRNISNLTIVDPSGNITHNTNRNRIHNINFRVPYTGFYKVRFKAVYTGKDEMAENMDLAVSPGGLDDFFAECKVLRHSLGDTDVFENLYFDNHYYKNNIKQDLDGIGNQYPKAHAVNFIDPKQNKNFVCGFSWGGDVEGKDDQGIYDYKSMKNPMIKDKFYHNPMAMSGGISWSIREPDSESFRAYSAVRSEGYVFEDDKPSGKYKIELSSLNDITPWTARTSNTNAEGEIHHVIWLQKNEYLSVVSTATFWEKANVWPNHQIYFELSLEPFSQDFNWMNMDNDGSSTKPMNWNEDGTYKKGEIDLFKFLPDNIKVNDWIDNFCKAFNLKLANTGIDSFELSIKNKDMVTTASSVIDLDKGASVQQRRNESLKLPSLYDIGFTVNTEEEGYYDLKKKSEGNTNGNDDSEIIYRGKYYTESTETNVLTQTSNFSYCWYKEILDFAKEPLFKIPVIMNHEAWENDLDYEDTMDDRYYDLPQRFWYKTGLFDAEINKRPVRLAKVSNEYNGETKLTLDYKDDPNSLLNNYFLLLLNVDNTYTVVNCYLTPEEYSRLDISLVKFNGNHYNIAEIDGYDPMRRSKGVLKLIKRMI